MTVQSKHLLRSNHSTYDRGPEGVGDPVCSQAGRKRNQSIRRGVASRPHLLQLLAIFSMMLL